MKPANSAINVVASAWSNLLRHWTADSAVRGGAVRVMTEDKASETYTSGRLSMSSPPRRRPSAEVDGAKMLGASPGKLSSALLDTHGQSFWQRSKSGSMQTYMEGLPKSMAALTDTILKVEGTNLPVHRAILAVNSPVFADLFAYALSRGSRSSRLGIPLVGDEVLDVRTALEYLYKGCSVCSSSELHFKSSNDAKSLVKFAHKYNIRSLVEACETYLVACLHQSGQHDFFSCTEALVEWTALAEQCELATFLAHCELCMMNDRDRSQPLWSHPAMTSDHISRRCSLRMLRGLQLQHRKSEDFITGLYGKMLQEPEMPREQVKEASALGCIPDTRPNHSVSIEKLVDWNK